jgi:hypothetical protein
MLQSLFLLIHTMVGPSYQAPSREACSCLPDNHCTATSAASEFRESRTADPLLRNSSRLYGGLIATPPDVKSTAASAASEFRRSRAAETSRPEASRPLFLVRSRGSILAPNCEVARLPKMHPRPAASVPPKRDQERGNTKCCQNSCGARFAGQDGICCDISEY